MALLILVAPAGGRLEIISAHNFRLGDDVQSLAMEINAMVIQARLQP